jgi:hypothetical protein
MPESKKTPMGIEPISNCFADSCHTVWLQRHKKCGVRSSECGVESTGSACQTTPPPGCRTGVTPYHGRLLQASGQKREKRLVFAIFAGGEAAPFSEKSEEYRVFPNRLPGSFGQGTVMGLLRNPNYKRPRQESNLVYDLRRVACEIRHTPRTETNDEL